MGKRKTPQSAENAVSKRPHIVPCTRWHHQSQPINDIKHIPKGWTAEAHDIHEDDITTNIEPYKERIKSHTMPVSWAPIMKKYERCKTELAKTTSSSSSSPPQGLNLDVCYRLRRLAEMKYEIKKNGDRLKLIPTIEAIMEAYRSGKLIWHDGLVTYWSGDKMICDGPKPFTWEDFDYYNKLHNGHYRFWVEGLNGPGAAPSPPDYAPIQRNLQMPRQNTHILHEVDFALRIPAKPYMNIGRNDAVCGNEDSEENFDIHSRQDTSTEFIFLDDIGSSVTVIYQDDLERLEDKARELGRIAGAVHLYGAFGGYRAIVYKMEVNMRDQNGNFMLDWTPIQVAVVDRPREVGSARLSGPWMRHQLCVGSSPDNRGVLCVAKTKPLLNQLIEMVSYSKAKTMSATSVLRGIPGRVFGQYRGTAVPALEPIPTEHDLSVQYWFTKQQLDDPNPHVQEGLLPSGNTQRIIGGASY